MKILITGAQGFLGKNLQWALQERGHNEIRLFTREHSSDDLHSLVRDVDFVFHLAGVNRPTEPSEFYSGNSELTRTLITAIQKASIARDTRPKIVYASSAQATIENDYGRSKKLAEELLRSFAREIDSSVYIFRLPNVFGKWCRPNYNSVVATFCHNIARGIPIQIHDHSSALQLVYVDDVVKSFTALLEGKVPARDGDGCYQIEPHYKTTVGEIARMLHAFRDSRDSLVTERVGTGLTRALYATYLSYLPPESFAYPVPHFQDPRGTFVEMLKTPDSGQFSYFTAYPGVTRGGHYHHTKAEKFMVVRGRALFRFRHIESGEEYQRETSGDHPEIVETIPGWAHDVTNVGSDELIVLLWGSETFDRNSPDTYSYPV